MKHLPYDYTRCRGESKTLLCSERDLCQRFETIALDRPAKYVNLAYCEIMRKADQPCDSKIELTKNGL